MQFTHDEKIINEIITETPEQKAIFVLRIFQEDEDMRQQRYLKEQEIGIIERQQKRLAVITKYTDELNDMISGKKKGIRFRKFFHEFVFDISKKKFLTEDDEYECIGKVGRRKWTSDNDLKKFNKKESEIIYEIIKEFGCFDY